MKIYNWITGEVIFDAEAESIADLVEKAVRRRVDLSAADLRGAKLGHSYCFTPNERSVQVERANFTGANLSGADLRNASLVEAVFLNAKLRGADFRGSDLESADFRHADLSGADLRDTDLTKANFEKAETTGADFRGSDLDGTGLSEQIKGDQ